MKTFKEFTRQSNGYVPDDPVHYKHVHVNAPLLEKAQGAKTPYSWEKKNDNEHIGNDNDEVGHVLRIGTTGHLHGREPSTLGAIKKHVNEYTKESEQLNRDLLERHKRGARTKVDPKHAAKVKHLDTATRKPIGHELHVYSGISFDPSKHLNENGHLHLPSYTSASHSKEVAHGFSYRGEAHENGRHILHIHMKPENHGTYVGHMSEHDHEHETILPRGTTLKVHPKPDVYRHGNSSTAKHNINVWHATVHHQEK